MANQTTRNGRAGTTHASTAPPSAEPDRLAEPPLLVVLSCMTCDLSWEPTPEDFAAGRLGCPDPDCGGWTYAASLIEPATGGAR